MSHSPSWPHTLPKSWVFAACAALFGLHTLFSQVQVLPVRAVEPIALRANEIAAKIARTDKALVFIYASWCGFCQQVMGGLLPILPNVRESGVTPLFISIDTRDEALTTYLSQPPRYGAFTPYVARLSGVNALEAALGRLGSGYTGRIPYIAVFARGKLRVEFTGAPDAEALAGALAER